MEENCRRFKLGDQFRYNDLTWTIKRVARGDVFVTSPEISKVQKIDWLVLQIWLENGTASFINPS